MPRAGVPFGSPLAVSIEQFGVPPGPHFRPDLKRQVILRYLGPTFVEQAVSLALIARRVWGRRCSPTGATGLCGRVAGSPNSTSSRRAFTAASQVDSES